ncbi:MAG TPA: transcriptional regulator [Geobacteraceae bacterium]
MRLLIWLLIGYCAYLLFKGRSSKEIPPATGQKGEETHRDPVCGVYVAEDDAVIGRVEEKRVYFCSMECLEKYREQLENK